MKPSILHARTLAACAALVTSGVACSAAPIDTSPEAVRSSSDHLYVDDNNIWPVNAFGAVDGTTRIEICWASPYTDFAHEKSVARQAIEDTWAHAANVSFVGWGECLRDSGGSYQNPEFGVRIAVDDSNPETTNSNPFEKALGTGVDHIVFNFTFNNWNPSCASMKDACISKIAVHEFGHLLGFAHEQNRADYVVDPARDDTTQCPNGQPNTQGSNGNTIYGFVDHESVMNYCNGLWNNGGKLSPTDIAGVQYYYGTRPQSSLIAPDGKCVRAWSVAGGDLQLGTADCDIHSSYANVAIGFDNGYVHQGSTMCVSEQARNLSACDALAATMSDLESQIADLQSEFAGAEPSQKASLGQRIRVLRGKLATTTAQWNACSAAAHYAAPQLGSQVTEQACSSNIPGLAFRMKDAQISYRGRCLETRSNGAGWNVVVLNKCDATNTSQLWELQPNGAIMAYHGLAGCLENATWSAEENAFLAVSPCTGRANQVWSINPGGNIVGYGNRCIDIPMGYDTLGTQLDLYSCVPGAPNEDFVITSSLRADADGACLELRGDGIHTATCAPAGSDGSRAQRFDFHP